MASARDPRHLEAIAERFEGELNVESFLLELEHGFTSLKYAYVGPAAHTHDELAKRDGYKANVDATTIEAPLVERHGASDQVEIGPGNGQHALQLLHELSNRAHPERILLLDFSRTLLDLCCARMIGTRALVIDRAHWDFEAGPTYEIDRWRRRPQEPLLATIIGHTLGNPRDLSGVLVNIANSLQAADRLLISVALRQDTDPLAGYETPEFRTAATEPFRMLGLAVEPGRLLLSVDSVASVVASVALTERERNHLSDQFGVQAPSIISCFQSRRFLPEDVPEHAQLSGLLREIDRSVATDGSHAAFVFECLERRP